ncbi:MAG: efflux transporter outer membrane subunit [Ferrimonas sp.]
MVIRRFAVIGVTPLVLAGCINLAPEYQRPHPQIPSQWPTMIEQGQAQTADGATSSASLDWRQFVLDTKLQRLIELGLSHNQNLQVAFYTLKKAEAQYGIKRANVLPELGISAAATQIRYPENFTSDPDTIYRDFSFGFGISSYELDFFSKVTNLERQALFDYLATEQGRRNTEIVLIASIASTYLTLMADNALVALAEETLKSQQESLALTKQSFDAGVVSGLDVAQSEVTVANAAVELAKFKNQLASTRHALIQLVGTAITDEMLPSNHEMDVLAPVQVGLPSELLAIRPDVRQAEFDLMAQNAVIGNARAAYFPSISLTATGGFLSGELSSLFERDSRSWTFSPSISLPIFYWGALDANLASAKAGQKLALASYQNTIQTAFQEVSDALSARAFLAQQLTAQQALVTATGKSYELSDLRFRQGVDSFYNVLESQQSYFSAEQNLITLRLSQQTNLIDLFRALGGGWVGNPVATATHHDDSATPAP